MSDKTAIEWTDTTWNPVRGCTRVSEGCRNCYAETLAARNLPGMRSPTTGEPFARRTPSGPRWNGKVELIESALDLPLQWRKPRRIFVNSMSDLFHEKLPIEDIALVFDVMASATADCRPHPGRPHEEDCWTGASHNFQILTKRPARMKEVIEELPHFSAERMPGDSPLSVAMEVGAWPLRNVWLGVSVENQATADERIPLLLQTPAAVRFLSCEPLLGPVNLLSVRSGNELCDVLAGYKRHVDLGEDDICPCEPTIDQVIAGGESGPGARPMHPAWAQSLRDQCAAAGVAFFWKQWGEWAPREWGKLVRLPRPDSTSRIGYFNGEHRFIPGGSAEGFQNMVRVGKKRAGRELDGRTWDEFPRARS